MTGRARRKVHLETFNNPDKTLFSQGGTQLDIGGEKSYKVSKPSYNEHLLSRAFLSTVPKHKCPII